MSTINDVQNAMVDVLVPIIYPNDTVEPSILGNYVESVTIINGGNDYTFADISFTGDGFGTTATATIEDGVIVAVTVDPPVYAYGYTTPPTVVVTGDGTGADLEAVLAPLIVYIAAGDFLKQNLDDGLFAGHSFIAVFAVNGMTRNTTRFKRYEVNPEIEEATLTLTVNGDTVTVGGTVTVGQSCMVIVNKVGYAYAALSNSTLDSIAEALADLIPNATVVGNVITVPNVFNMVGRISVKGIARQIQHSQESIFRVRVYANSNEKRDLLCAAIETGFGDYGYYLPMPDSVAASIRPKGITEMNMTELANAFVRDYLFLVEYHTVKTSTFQTIASVSSDLSVTTTPFT